MPIAYFLRHIFCPLSFTSSSLFRRSSYPSGLLKSLLQPQQADNLLEEEEDADQEHASNRNGDTRPIFGPRSKDKTLSDTPSFSAETDSPSTHILRSGSSRVPDARPSPTGLLLAHTHGVPEDSDAGDAGSPDLRGSSVGRSSVGKPTELVQHTSLSSSVSNGNREPSEGAMLSTPIAPGLQRTGSWRESSTSIASRAQHVSALREDGDDDDMDVVMALRGLRMSEEAGALSGMQDKDSNKDRDSNNDSESIDDRFNPLADDLNDDFTNPLAEA